MVADESAEQPCASDRRLALLWVFPEVHGTRLDFGAGPWRIGRGPDCHIVVGDQAASRAHAEVFYKGPLVVLRDLGSRNGTFIDGVPVQQVPVRSGSVIRIGEWVGVFCPMPAASEGDSFFTELLPGYHAGPSLRRALAGAARAAIGDLSIVIEGATGTGKERVAEYIHARSGRSGPFHPINCAAIPADMAESQLFGHRRGAFTGAAEAALGHFRAAAGGTLFLDEVIELPLAVQAKLLRAVQEGKVTPVGETGAVSVDVRIIAASQERLETVVARGAFRVDLHARLSGLVVQLPTLAEHIEDVPYLFRKFLEMHAGGFEPTVEGRLIEQLCLYDWPMNVRELELLARQLLLVHGHERKIKRAHLPSPIREAGAPRQPNSEASHHTDLKRLAHALYASGGNVTKACASLGISRARAYRLMAGQSVQALLVRHVRGNNGPAAGEKA